MRPARPATTHNETWPNIAADVSATAQDQTWEAMAGQNPISGNPLMTCVAGNKIQPASKGAYTGVMCLTAVSSVDHTVSGTIVTLVLSNSDALVWCRARTPHVTGYAAGRQGGVVGGDGGRVLTKWITGTQTVLAQDAGYAGTGPVITVTAEGSTITGTCTGETNHVESDSAVSDGVRGIAWLVAATSQANAQMGAWSISDVVQAPVAAFTGSPLSGTSPLSVAFDSSATTNTPTGHLWEKNDGSGWVNFAGTPTVANPTESFAAGTWSVRYTATNAGGSNTKTETDYVTVEDPPSGKSLAGSYSLDTWRGLGL
jgi:hypothetical protein